MKRTGAQIVWDVLQAEGTEVVFGYPGGAIMPVYDALYGHPLRHVLVRHEQGAAHMADGYARASGKVGVALATSGPGATTLPMRIYSQVRLGVTPEINAICTILIGIVATGVVAASIINKRREVQRVRDEQVALQG